MIRSLAAHVTAIDVCDIVVDWDVRAHFLFRVCRIQTIARHGFFGFTYEGNLALIREWFEKVRWYRLSCRWYRWCLLRWEMTAHLLLQIGSHGVLYRSCSPEQWSGDWTHLNAATEVSLPNNINVILASTHSSLHMSKPLEHNFLFWYRYISFWQFLKWNHQKFNDIGIDWGTLKNPKWDREKGTEGPALVNPKNKMPRSQHQYPKTPEC